MIFGLKDENNNKIFDLQDESFAFVDGISPPVDLFGAVGCRNKLERAKANV